MTAAKAITVRTGCALYSIWLAGCSISQPQSAAEFRSAAAGAQTAAKDTFEVNRPLSQVAASFQKLASECLSKTIRTMLRNSEPWIVTDARVPCLVVEGEILGPVGLMPARYVRQGARSPRHHGSRCSGRR